MTVQRFSSKSRSMAKSLRTPLTAAFAPSRSPWKLRNCKYSVSRPSGGLKDVQESSTIDADVSTRMRSAGGIGNTVTAPSLFEVIVRVEARSERLRIGTSLSLPLTSKRAKIAAKELDVTTTWPDVTKVDRSGFESDASLKPHHKTRPGQVSSHRGLR